MHVLGSHMDSIFSYCCRYAQFGDVSPKVDVYAFGVVLYELISAKEAVVKTGVVIKSDGSNAESKGLVALASVSCLSFILFILAFKNISH